jgi:large subunit ribosomal protein L22
LTSARLRNRKVETARKMLEEVINKEKAVPIKRFNRDCGHKRGTGPGKFPVTAAKAILLVLNNAESNAKSKGLSGNLVIEHIIAQKAPSPWHYGRKRRRKMKRAHVEIVLAEEKKDAK